MEKFSWRIALLSALPIALLLVVNACMLQGLEEASPKIKQGTRFPNFTTQDIYGNTVTNDIFKGNFSVVYLWVTKDADISRNMCSLMTKFATETSQSFKFVGIVGDAKEGSASKISLARSLTEDLPPDMIQILPNDDMLSFLQSVHSTPFVCFVDEKGNFIGQPVVGNEPELVEKEVHRLITENSLTVETAAKAQKSLFDRP